MTSGATEHLVTTDWLAGRLGDPGIAILDASWHLPAENRDAEAEFAVAHIPGAQFFNVDTIADRSTGLPHMLPTDEQFAEAARSMGIGDATHVIAYDSRGLFSAPRVWWTFRAFGAARVSVLDGGLPRWLAEGRPLETGAARQRPRANFTLRRDAGLVRTLAQMRGLLTAATAQIIDARPAGRFSGADPEPRPGLTQGHMPGARNLPFTSLMTADGHLKPPGELSAILAAAGIDPGQPAVASCGSGVTAAVAALALAVVGNPQAAIYDGSWAEWGRDPANPVETGAARAAV